MHEQIAPLKRPLAGQRVDAAAHGEDVLKICEIGENFLLSVPGDMLAVKPILTDSGYVLEILSSYVDDTEAANETSKKESEE